MFWHCTFLGIVNPPSEIKALSLYDLSSGIISVICQWKYSGNLSNVAYFDVEIKNGNTTIYENTVNKTVQRDTFVIDYVDNDSSYSAVVTTFDNCNNFSSAETTFPYGIDA